MRRGFARGHPSTIALRGQVILPRLLRRPPNETLLLTKGLLLMLPTAAFLYDPFAAELCVRRLAYDGEILAGLYGAARLAHHRKHELAYP